MNLSRTFHCTQASVRFNRRMHWIFGMLRDVSHAMIFRRGNVCVCAFVRALCSLALCNVMFTVYRGNISFLFYRFCWMILVLLLLLIRLPLLLLLLRSILFGARQRFVFGWKNQMRFGWWCLANNKSVLRRTPYDFPAMHHTSKNVQFFFSCFHRLFWW